MGLFVANWYDQTLSRIDTTSNSVLSSIPLDLQGNAGPQAIAYGEGALWVAVLALRRRRGGHDPRPGAARRPDHRPGGCIDPGRQGQLRHRDQPGCRLGDELRRRQRHSHRSGHEPGRALDSGRGRAVRHGLRLRFDLGRERGFRERLEDRPGDQSGRRDDSDGRRPGRDRDRRRFRVGLELGPHRRSRRCRLADRPCDQPGREDHPGRQESGVPDVRRRIPLGGAAGRADRGPDQPRHQCRAAPGHGDTPGDRPQRRRRGLLGHRRDRPCRLAHEDPARNDRHGATARRRGARSTSRSFLGQPSLPPSRCARCSRDRLVAHATNAAPAGRGSRHDRRGRDHRHRDDGPDLLGGHHAPGEGRAPRRRGRRQARRAARRRVRRAGRAGRRRAPRSPATSTSSSSRRPTRRTCRSRSRPSRPASTSTWKSRWRSTSPSATQIVEATRNAGLLCAVASQSRYNDISIRAKQLIDDGTIGPIRFFRVTSPTVGWDVPADGWFVDPKEGGAYLDWGPHGCDTLRWFTGTDATLAFGMFDNFGDIPALDPSAMVSYRLGSGRHGPVLDELRDPVARPRVVHAVARGRRERHARLRPRPPAGRAGATPGTRTSTLPAWDWLVDPMADPAHRDDQPPGRPVRARPGARRAARHHRRGRPGGDRDGRGGDPLGAHGRRRSRSRSSARRRRSRSASSGNARSSPLCVCRAVCF